jgi:xanthine dehydrogenase accessory factor
LTKYLATMALFNGFAVMGEMPDDVVRVFRPDCRSCVLALTYAPKLDDMALL